MKKKYCPTRFKPKHFNEAWARIAAEETFEKYGTNVKPYKCPCGWWHVFDRMKKRQKDDARETRGTRRKRRKLEKRTSDS